MSLESDLKFCPQCGAPLPVGAAHGLCPRCVYARAMAPTVVGGGSPHRAPEIEDIRAAFPQFEVSELIGVGGMGSVFKVRQTQLDRWVALKILAPQWTDDPQFSARFLREAKALARLNHPNIVTIHDFGKAGEFYYLVMELVDGVNLRQAMKAGRFTPEQALNIVPRVCEALQYAHEQGVVHRDIKPENLLMDKSGRVKIADFGIAKMLHDPGPDIGFTETQPAGTPQYMAPEQMHRGAADHRADIYSLGVVLYEMLTGELPDSRRQPVSKKVQVDVRLDEIVLRALETTPELRFQTAAEFRNQLETVATPPKKAEGEENEEEEEDEDDGSINYVLWRFMPVPAVVLAFWNPWGGRAWFWFAGCCAVLAVLPKFPRTGGAKVRRAAFVISTVLITAAATWGGYTWYRRSQEHAGAKPGKAPPKPGVVETKSTAEPELLKVQLRHAEEEYEIVRKRYEAGLATHDSTFSALERVEVLKAQIAGDPLGVASARLNVAQDMLKSVEARHKAGQVSEAELKAAENQVEIRQLEMKQAEKTQKVEAGDKSAQTPVEAEPAVSPRDVVAKWLKLVKNSDEGENAKTAWTLVNQNRVSWSIDFTGLWNYESIRPAHLYVDANEALVLTNTYTTNAGKEEVSVFYMVKKSGNWLIDDHGRHSVDAALSFTRGVLMHKDAKFKPDVTPAELVGGEWMAPCNALMKLAADGTGTRAPGSPTGYESPVPITWNVSGDILSVKGEKLDLKIKIYWIEDDDFHSVDFGGTHGAGFSRLHGKP